MERIYIESFRGMTVYKLDKGGDGNSKKGGGRINSLYWRGNYNFAPLFENNCYFAPILKLSAILPPQNETIC